MSKISFKRIGYYIDDNNQLVKCTSEKECITTEHEDSSAYINVSSKIINKYLNVITCTGNNCSSNKRSTERAYAYINNEDPTKVF